MLEWYRILSHTVTSCKVHLVWWTKYRYKILKWEIQLRCRDIIRQTCDSMDIQILKGVVSRDHVHMLIEYPPKLWISEIVKRLKGRSSRILLKEFQELRRRYWWQHMWWVWYFAATSWNITDEIIEEYLEHHRNIYKSLKDDNTFILE